MTVYRYELARRGDAPLLATMSRRLIEAGLRPAWDAARITWHVRDADSVVLLARTEFEVAGFAVMRYGAERAHLNLLAVEPRHRRRGVGRGLLGWLEETALTAGTFTIGLELRASNAAAQAFYRACGYRDCGEVPGYYQGVEAALRFTRDLRVARGQSAPPAVSPEDPGR
ncbi:MAG: GNAT family N-acetyltransferase [Gammaproteobacteria bacterium]|nr:GNAT family N-acetyltransferase [Gammaproteobacteria bacterium]